MKFLLCMVLVVIATTKGDDEILHEFFNNNLQFTADVYKVMLKSHRGNFLVCPLSIQTILALVHAGAAGNTAKQLSTGLRLPESDDDIQEVFTTLLWILQDHTKQSITTANKIYIMEQFEIKDEFKSIAVNTFTSEIQNIDFSKSEEAASEINKWVEKKTHDKIRNLIASEDLNSGTLMVLINAVYFNAAWSRPFTGTEKKPFNVNKRKQIDVDMMSRTDTFGYFKSSALNAKFLLMPYAHIDSSMIIILPDDIEGLQALEEAHIADILVTADFNEDLFEEVHVQIPKFKSGSTIELKPILQTLGVIDAFTDNANFSKISEGSVMISSVIQKTFIEVNEKDTTAAAATDAEIMSTSTAEEPPPLPEFIADHPFMYIIETHGIVLFIGCYKGE